MIECIPEFKLGEASSELVSGRFEYLTLQVHSILPALALGGNFYAYPKQLIFTVQSPCCNDAWDFVWGEKSRKALRACGKCGVTISEDPSIIFANSAPSWALKPVWNLITWGFYETVMNKHFDSLEQNVFTAVLEENLLALADWLFEPQRANAGINSEARARREAIKSFTLGKAEWTSVEYFKYTV